MPGALASRTGWVGGEALRRVLTCALIWLHCCSAAEVPAPAEGQPGVGVLLPAVQGVPRLGAAGQGIQRHRPQASRGGGSKAAAGAAATAAAAATQDEAGPSTATEHRPGGGGARNAGQAAAGTTAAAATQGSRDRARHQRCRRRQGAAQGQEGDARERASAEEDGWGQQQQH